MKLTVITTLCLVWLLLSLTNCTKSLVYSPSLNLPPEPLKKNQVQLLGGVGYLPETRPHKTKENIAVGGEAAIRYAISDYFTFQLKGWQDFSDNLNDDRSGFSIAVIVMLNDSSDFRYALIPTGALLVADGDFEGGGGAIPIGFWYTKYNPFNFYASIGPAFGMRDLTKEKAEWGWGVLLNLGAGILIQDHLTLNLEISGIKQVNEYDKREDFILVPGLNIGYIF